MNEIQYVHNIAIHNTKSAEKVLPYLFSYLNPKTVIDIGCGIGSWLAIAKKLGANEIIGIDGNHVDRKLLIINKQEFIAHDLKLTIDLERKFDLGICLEVAEHLPENSADQIIGTLVLHADVILFSAAIINQGGQNHLNEQNQEYWQSKFAEHKFVPFDILRDKFWEDENVDWWYKQNMILYAKPNYQQVLNHEPTKKVLTYVHPNLLQETHGVISNLNQIINDKIFKPKFLSSLKLLIKSIVK